MQLKEELRVVLAECEKELVNQLEGALIDKWTQPRIQEIMKPFTDKFLSLVVTPTVKVEQIGAYEVRVTFPKHADLSNVFDGGKDEPGEG
jgi:hypothetical protein